MKSLRVWMQLALIVGLCGAMPVWATPISGSISGRVYDTDLNDEPLPNQYVHLSSTQGWYYQSTQTDANGEYAFDYVYDGVYQVRITPGPKYGRGYMGFIENVAVEDGADVVVDFPLEHLEGNVTVSAKGATGAVGNTFYLDFEIIEYPGVYELEELYLWLWVQRGTYLQNFWLVRAERNWQQYIDHWEWLDSWGERRRARGKVPVRTGSGVGSGGGFGLPNGPASGAGGGPTRDAWNPPGIWAGAPPVDNPNGAGEPGGEVAVLDVQNLVIKNMNTNAGVAGARNEDYFLYDPAADSPYDEPWVSFDIEDNGPTADGDGVAYTYQWAVAVVSTDHTTTLTKEIFSGGGAPNPGWDHVIYGTRTTPGPVHVPIPLEGWGEPETDEEGVTTLRPAKGSYTFEIAVRELRYDYPVDEYWAKWPYRMLVPKVAADGQPGHKVGLTMPSESTYALDVAYLVQDASGREASQLRATALRPDLSQLGGLNLPRTVGERHGPLTVASFDAEDLEPGDYRVIITGVDDHVNHPGPGEPLTWYRDGQPKRMLAVNQAVGRPLAQAYCWRVQYEGRPHSHHEGMQETLGSRLVWDSERTMPGFAVRTSNDNPPYLELYADFERYPSQYLLLHAHGRRGVIEPHDAKPFPGSTVDIEVSAHLDPSSPMPFSIETDWSGKLSSTTLIVFLSCESGLTDPPGQPGNNIRGFGNLLEAAVVYAGAHCAVGWLCDVPGGTTVGTYWLTEFQRALSNGIGVDGRPNPEGIIDRRLSTVDRALQYANAATQLRFATSTDPEEVMFIDFMTNTTMYTAAGGFEPIQYVTLAPWEPRPDGGVLVLPEPVPEDWPR
ncbi:MAG TPA: hypothetical protein DD420_04370 [Streptomyces sp.]|mgnify:CR=1 FL=1|nr:hypothetical protein [Armatimonadota bacterium]HBF79179.1 hypothetical protein [Streptomyces sp.]